MMTFVVSFLLVALVIVNFALSSAFLMGPGVRSLFVPCEQVCLTSFSRPSYSLRVARPSYSLLLAVKSVNTAYAVTELLEIVQPGLEGQYSAEQRNRIDELLAVLDAAGEGGSFLNDISINDYYRVEFTRDVARGKPVGGLFRYSALGRSLFKTEDAFQHVVGNQAVNLLRFRFANVCPGIIVLRGTFERCSASERREIERKYQSPPPGLSPETIKVLFEPPRIFFGVSGLLNFEVGPQTTVYLDTTYLDERVRIGRNRFGGHFVFKRLTATEKAPGSVADSWRPLLKKPKLPLVTVGLYVASTLSVLLKPSLLPSVFYSIPLPRRAVAVGLATALPLAILFLASLI